jgi:hypothetical protein
MFENPLWYMRSFFSLVDDDLIHIHIRNNKNKQANRAATRSINLAGSCLVLLCEKDRKKGSRFSYLFLSILPSLYDDCKLP